MNKPKSDYLYQTGLHPYQINQIVDDLQEDYKDGEITLKELTEKTNKLYRVSNEQIMGMLEMILSKQEDSEYKIEELISLLIAFASKKIKSKKGTIKLDFPGYN